MRAAVAGTIAARPEYPLRCVAQSLRGLWAAGQAHTAKRAKHALRAIFRGNVAEHAKLEWELTLKRFDLIFNAGDGQPSLNAVNRTASGFGTCQQKGVRNRASIARFFRSQPYCCAYGSGGWGRESAPLPFGGIPNPVRPARPIWNVARRVHSDQKEMHHAKDKRNNRRSVKRGA